MLTDQVHNLTHNRPNLKHTSVHTVHTQIKEISALFLPECCHSNDGVPEGGRDAGKFTRAWTLFCVEHDSSKDNYGHCEREEQEAQFRGAALQSVAQDAQALRMAGELKDAEHTENSERHKSAAHVLIVSHHQANVVGQDGHHVDDAHHGPHEAVAARCGEQAHQVLHCEDHDAGRVHAEKGHCVALPAWHLLLVGGRAAGYRFHHIGDDRDSDKEAGDVVEHKGHGGSVGVLESPPHGLPEGHVGQLSILIVLLVIHQTLSILSLPILVLFITAVADDLRDDAKEG